MPRPAFVVKVSPGNGAQGLRVGTRFPEIVFASAKRGERRVPLPHIGGGHPIYFGKEEGGVAPSYGNYFGSHGQFSPSSVGLYRNCENDLFRNYKVCNLFY